MPNEWCYEIDGEFHGPVPWEELRRLARTGRIGPTTMLRRGRGEWLVARHVPGVFEGVAAEPRRTTSRPAASTTRALIGRSAVWASRRSMRITACLRRGGLAGGS